MATNYTTLAGAKTVPGSIANWMNKSGLPIDTILEEAQSYIFTRLRVQQMWQEATISALQDATTLTLPARFIDSRQLWIPKYGVRLHKVPATDLESVAIRDEDGIHLRSIPRFFTIINVSGVRVIQLDCKLQEDLSFKLLYYGRPLLIGEPVSAVPTQSNFLATDYPHILRRAVMLHAAEWTGNDEVIARIKPLLNEDILTVATQDDLEQTNVEPIPEYYDG